MAANVASDVHHGTVAPASSDARWMARCLTLARRGTGFVSPNPRVGAVIVGADGTVLGEGYHARYGEAHAEARALADARATHDAAALRQATLYVNLEPCNHHGKTPPCTDRILAHDIPRVVVGMVDPFPAVAGRGIERLRAAGVDVTVGVLPERCYRLNEAFVHHVRTGRPLVTLKIAQTLDGRIATRTGDSRWISGTEARTMVHAWRAAADGVLVGAGTAAADNPRLTVRHVEGPQPQRLVLDRRGTLDPSLHLFSDDQAATTTAVLGATRAAPPYAEALRAAGGRVLRIPERDGHLDLSVLLQHLGDGAGEARPVQSLLVEAGPGLATALVRQALVDRFFLFIAPKLVGAGRPTLRDLGIEAMAEARTFAAGAWEPVGDDMLFRGYMHPAEAGETRASS
ncbi:bifunctional diaminohydroxyphosphoribosylaminopyrimidine deaminase/5-amino-6-(5-phosphoribosylamino)uracil reductase RibD [Salisaeta longa]|uniref:bifunctional diaminohydroxyphosphoribosylaminopyrimidine deaminase/5-amino-6-(5-phosphoribosylamino)uracil reductase RibD n=1 Tax=Salisaeta longa TaxID=503170 RepID=UPI0003B30A65|nr:bifunctional diaminohydroxyphosphoribosylaminopyrimidine deaminase/5-amino-6-(5-phosphoribosylamino)uracil reductase RibD [Salisaeta longa]